MKPENLQKNLQTIYTFLNSGKVKTTDVKEVHMKQYEAWITYYMEVDKATLQAQPKLKYRDACVDGFVGMNALSNFVFASDGSPVTKEAIASRLKKDLKGQACMPWTKLKFMNTGVTERALFVKGGIPGVCNFDCFVTFASGQGLNVNNVHKADEFAKKYNMQPFAGAVDFDDISVPKPEEIVTVATTGDLSITADDIEGLTSKINGIIKGNGKCEQYYKDETTKEWNLLVEFKSKVVALIYGASDKPTFNEGKVSKYKISDGITGEVKSGASAVSLEQLLTQVN